MFVLWLAVVVLVSDPSSALTCNNGGTPLNTTSCNCTGTCFSGATCETHDTCGEIPTLPHSQWVWKASGSGCDGMLTYTCDVGYTISNTTNTSGNITVTCSSSSWSTPQATCTRVPCPAPLVGRNARILGRVDESGYFYNDKLAFECRDFTRGQEGHIQRTCQADGTWSGKPLMCSVTITSAIVIGLIVALWCLALAIILPYDFISYLRRQRRLKELRSHTYRIGQASLLTTPTLWIPVSHNDKGVIESKRRKSSRGNEPSLFLSAEVKQQFYDRLSGAEKMEALPEDLSGSSIESHEFSDMEDVGMGDSVEMLVKPTPDVRGRGKAYFSDESDNEIAESAH